VTIHSGPVLYPYQWALRPITHWMVH